MSKSIVSFTAQLVTFDTSLAVDELIRRLDTKLHRDQAGVANIGLAIGKSKNKQELHENLEAISGGDDFMFFDTTPHFGWLRKYVSPEAPVNISYTFGNPLVAQSMFKYDYETGLNVPLRLLVLEKEDHSGTKVLYHLPSSFIAINDNGPLREAAEVLDRKIEKLVLSVTQEA